MTLRPGRPVNVELEAPDLYARLDPNNMQGRRIDDADRQQVFLNHFGTGLDESLSNAGRLHGWRLQNLFEAMVVSLGRVKLIKTEDSGSYFFDDETGDVKLPDFRIVTHDNQSLLVEVKNIAPGQKVRTQRLGREYLDAQLRYAEWTNSRLMWAHYWSALNLWSLVDAAKLGPTGNTVELTLETAMKMSEMRVLGDKLVATTPPLVMSLVADESKPRRTRETDKDKRFAQFTVGKVEFRCGSQPINGGIEQQIAFFLILYGRWQKEPMGTFDSEEKPERIDWVCTPQEQVPGQEFQMVGYLCELYSMLYNVATLGDEGSVQTLWHEPDPGFLAKLIPPDYWDEQHDLPLWLFEMHPS